MKTLLHIFGIAQHQNGVARYKSCFGRKIQIHFTVAFNRHNIDAVLFAHIRFYNGFSNPFFGYGNFNNRMIAVQLYVIEDMVGGIANRRPIGKLPFGIYDFIRPVSQKKLCVYIPCRTRTHHSCPQLL